MPDALEDGHRTGTEATIHADRTLDRRLTERSSTARERSTFFSVCVLRSPPRRYHLLLVV